MQESGRRAPRRESSSCRCTRALRCVHHEVAAPAPQQVDHSGAFSGSVTFRTWSTTQPGSGEDAGGAARRRQREAEVGQAAATGTTASLSPSQTDRNAVLLDGSGHLGCALSAFARAVG